MDDSRLYHAIPKWLEKITTNRNWERELQVLKSVLPTDQPIWEWGCKTGYLGQFLKYDHDWQGGESNPEYFRIGHNRHKANIHPHEFPSSPVACIYAWFSPLFSVKPEELGHCLTQIFNSVKPSGWVVLEAGSNPAHARSRFSMMDIFEDKDEKLVRAAVPTLDDSVITFKYRWMVALKGAQKIEEVHETHQYFLHPDESVTRIVQELGGVIRLIEVDGIRIWLMSKQVDVIERLMSSL